MGTINPKNMEAYVKVKPRIIFSPLLQISKSLALSGDLGGVTLAPGIYKATEAILIQTGDLTLDAQGNENAVWVFQLDSDFTTVGGAGGNIVLRGNAHAKNVFWQTDRQAKIGEGTSFNGNILAKMVDGEGVFVGRQSLKNRNTKVGLKNESSMGWPHYGQRL
jgi:hypothetical protein